MTARKRRRSRGLAAILLLVAWCCAATTLAHPGPLGALLVAFAAGMVTGAALAHHALTIPRRPGPAPRPGAAPAASSPPAAAATARPAASPRRGPGPRLSPVPDPEALRATLAARADRVSSYVPKPPDTGETTP